MAETNQNTPESTAADIPVAWDDRNTRAWAGVAATLAEKVEALGGGEKLQEAFYSFLLRNEEEIMTKSAGPARDFLLDMKARKEKGFV